MNFRYFLSFYLIITLFFILGLAKVSLAQFTPSLNTNFSVNFTPEIPSPNQSVYAEVTSYGTNLDRATITWRVNNSVVSSGIGRKNITFQTGNSGSTTNVSITILTSEGETLTENFSIRPSSVDIIWQADTYTPPFFKGKSLFSHESLITFIAVPHLVGQNGQIISSNNLIYTWKRNGQTLTSSSGYGKNTYAFQATVISRPLEIEVSVTSPNSDAVGRATTVVSPVDPIVIMYEKNPLYGIQFNRALTGSISLNNKEEMEVVGLPLFFSGKNLSNNNIVYDWNINYSNFDAKTLERSKVFRPIEGTSGSSYVSISIENASKLLQTATAGFNIQFNKE